MKTRTVSKPEKIALCRECHGTGKIFERSDDGIKCNMHDRNAVRSFVKCPNCAGSGRVLVSCEMTLHIRPYKPQC